MDSPVPMKVFTLEQANSLVPQLTQWLGELRARREEILKLEVEIDATELVTDKDDSGISGPVNLKVENYTRLVNRFYSLIDEIHGTGCLLKDVDMGLVDFYSVQEGHTVFLCWKMGEPRVSYWHEVGEGFIDRHPVQPS